METKEQLKQLRVASPSCKMNDLKQFLLELNQTNLTGSWTNVTTLFYRFQVFFLIEREILFHVSTAVDFIDHSNVTTAGFIELVLVTFLIIVRWHLNAT